MNDPETNGRDCQFSLWTTLKVGAMDTGNTFENPEKGPPIFIQAAGLTKRFGEISAVDGASSEVSLGELFGFLGPNGAGKTTTINMLTGLARPDTGEIRVGGLDCTGNPKAAQHLIGVVPDESNLYPELSGFDNLCFCAALYGMRREERRSRARELLETFGFREAADLGLFVAVAVSEAFEEQTFSNFFRMPMIFLCGLFFPVDSLPVYLRPVSYLLPLTYGADILHGAINDRNTMSLGTDFSVISLYCLVLFYLSLRGIKKKWIM